MGIARRILGTVLAFAGAVPLAVAADTADSIRTLGFGPANIAMSWSPDWRIAPAGPETAPQTVEFGTADALELHALMTLLSKDIVLEGDADMHAAAEKMAAGLASQAVEKNLEIQSLKGTSARGYYVCATDRAPMPAEYEFVCTGVARVGDSHVAFTLLFNKSGRAESQQVLEALGTMQIANAA